eukprot:766337-Hanusia_phi.AAC.5
MFDEGLGFSRKTKGQRDRRARQDSQRTDRIEKLFVTISTGAVASSGRKIVLRAKPSCPGIEGSVAV